VAGSALVVLLAVALSTALVHAWAFRPVSFGRLDRFARRERLRVTTTSAVPVLRYLAITRRWRAVGLACSACVLLAAGLRQRELRLDPFLLFVGWFAGAIGAEWRLGERPIGPVRRAVVVRRELGGYLDGWSRALVVLVTALGLGAATVNVVRSASLGASLLPGLVLTAGLLASVGVTWLAGRRIVNRPQPVGSDDLLAADEALRTHSLRVLGGSSVVLAACATAMIIAVAPGMDERTVRLSALAATGAGLAAGWWVARVRSTHGGTAPRLGTP
jgi:hypothetical protein